MIRRHLNPTRISTMLTDMTGTLLVVDCQPFVEIGLQGVYAGSKLSRTAG